MIVEIHSLEKYEFNKIIWMLENPHFDELLDGYFVDKNSFAHLEIKSIDNFNVAEILINFSVVSQQDIVKLLIYCDDNDMIKSIKTRCKTIDVKFNDKRRKL